MHALHKESHQSQRGFPLKGEISEADRQSSRFYHAEVVKAQSATVEAMFKLMDSLSDDQKLMMTTKRGGADKQRPQRSGRPTPQR